MQVEKFICGPLNNNSYLVWDEKTSDAAVIDPSKAAEQILQFIKKKKLKIAGILNTHYHFDHVFDNAKLKKETNVGVMMHGADVPYYEKDGMAKKFIKEELEKVEINVWLKEGDAIKFGNERLNVIHTPGHSEGSICLYSQDDAILFTGDTLFAGTYGRVDLPGSDADKMKKSLARLANFPELTKVYPGHAKETVLNQELEWLNKFKE